MSRLRALAYTAYSQAVGALPDALAIPLHFRLRTGYWPDLRDPKTFNERIQHRKLHGDGALFARYADKLRAKEIVGSALGEPFVLPTIWRGKRLPPANKREWPLPVIMKSNHSSGRNIIVRSAAELAGDQLDETSRRWMTRRSYPHLKEHFYELIERELFVEPFLGENLVDYKFYVFGGEVRCIHVDTDRRTDHKRIFYDRDWRRLPLTLRYPSDPRDLPPPLHLQEMIEGAETLGRDFDFVRADFYDLPDGPRFGELTFTPGGGYERFTPRDWDSILGSYWPATGA